MLQLYRENRIFYNLTFLFTLLGAIILVLTDKGEVEVYINGFTNPFLDFIFYYITYLGDGILITLVIIFMLVRKVWYGLMSAVIFALTSLITQVLKRTFFSDFPRPSKFFDPSQGLVYLKDLELHHWNSFPSGHSSGAFTIFLLISLITRKPGIQVICFCLALSDAFSRVYLLQHFYMDIYGGALLAVVLTSVFYYLLQYKTNLPHNPKLNQPLRELLR